MSDGAPSPVEVGPSPIHGQGVFAAIDISSGSHLGTYEGLRTDNDGTHVLWVEGDENWNLIDGTGVLRWLNHSRTPNAEFDGPELYSVADISRGTEITFDYGPDWAGVE